jgi:hypothetical protein
VPSPLGSGDAHDPGGAGGREAVHECDADLDFSSLAVGISRGDAFPERLEAAHLCLDPASGVVSGPALPERPAIVAGGAQGFVPGRCRRAVLFPKSAVLTDRNDRGCLSGDDSGVATAGVIGAIHCPAGSCEA